jgi:sec-independent protein translocase protein TatB
MFDFSWSELLLIGIVALVFIGPKELPGVLRTVGQWMAKVRRMASDFQGQFQDAMREAELAELKKEVDEMTSQASHYANLDPLGEARKEMDKTQREIESALAGTPAANNSEASSPTAAVQPPENEPAIGTSPSQSQADAHVPDAAPTAPENTTAAAPADETKVATEGAGTGGEHR